MAFAAVPGMAQQDEGPILLPKKQEVKPAGATMLVLCDLACNWKLDGEAKGRIDAGGSAKAKVELGRHLVVAVTEDGLDQVKQLSEVKTPGQTIVSLALEPVRDARLKAEQVTTLLVLCDLACNWKLDGKPQGRIDAGGSTRAKVDLGQHLVVAVTEDGADQVKQLSEVKQTGQTVVNLELKPVRDARLNATQPTPLPAPQLQPAPVAPNIVRTEPAKVLLPEGTQVFLSFDEYLSSKTAIEGDLVQFSLTQDIRVNNVLVVRAGTKAFGVVSHALKSAIGGKGGALNIRIEYFKVGDVKVLLRGSRGKEAGNNSYAMNMLTGNLALLFHGKEVVIQRGTALIAFVADDVSLTPIN
jgi:hypothetical protein